MKRFLALSFVLALGCGGDDGSVGPAGVAGPEGPAGTDGSDGSAGTQGTAGTAGIDGTNGMDGVNGVQTPSINAVNPAAGFLDRTVDVQISGNGTTWAAPTVDFGAGVTVNAVDVASPTGIFANVTIAGDATAGTATVTVTEGGASLTYAGFDIAAPLSVNLENGGFAQGGIAFVSFSTSDIASPFLDGPGAGITVGAGTGSFISNLDSYNGTATVFVDVLEVVGATDLFVTDDNGTISRAQGAVDVTANTPQVETPETDATAVIANVLDTVILQYDVPANSAMAFSVTSSDAGGNPIIFGLPDTGAFADAFAQGVSTGAFNNDTAAAVTVYLVATDDAAPGDLTVVTSVLATVAEVEPNDDFANAQAITPDAVVIAEIAVVADNDWFAVAMLTGETLTTTTQSNVANECENFTIDSEIEVFDTDGITSLDFDDDGGPGFCSEIVFVAPADGTYFIRTASSAAFDPSGVYLYNLDVLVQ